MARFKQRIQSFETAKRNFNKKKVELEKEFTKEMHKAKKAGDERYFEDLCDDARKHLDKSFEFTITSIILMYNDNNVNDTVDYWNVKRKAEELRRMSGDDSILGNPSY